MVAARTVVSERNHGYEYIVGRPTGPLRSRRWWLGLLASSSRLAPVLPAGSESSLIRSAGNLFYDREVVGHVRRVRAHRLGPVLGAGVACADRARRSSHIRPD